MPANHEMVLNQEERGRGERGEGGRGREREREGSMRILERQVLDDDTYFIGRSMCANKS